MLDSRAVLVPLLARRAPAFQLLLCSALMAAAGCIERPWPDGPSVRAVDRAALRDVLIPAPADATPVGATFGNAAELVAYKVEPSPVVTGKSVKLTLYWRCITDLEQWHVFVHLDDANRTGGRLHAEHEMAQGRFPTEAWKPGDVIADSITFQAPAFPMLLYLGLYSQGETRLALTSAGRGRDDGNNRLLAGLLPLAK